MSDKINEAARECTDDLHLAGFVDCQIIEAVMRKVVKNERDKLHKLLNDHKQPRSDNVNGEVRIYSLEDRISGMADICEMDKAYLDMRIIELEAEHNELRAEVERLRKALAKYGRHFKYNYDAECTRSTKDCSYHSQSYECDCGFTEALADQQPRLKRGLCKECNGSGVYEYKYKNGSEECDYCEGTGYEAEGTKP